MVTLKVIPEFPDYRAGSDGRIYSSWKRVGPPDWWILGDTFWPMKSSIKKCKCDYPQVGLKGEGKQRWRTVHSLVASAWIGPRPEGMECCHADDDVTNSRPENLSYGTKESNDNQRRQNAAMKAFERAMRKRDRMESWS